MATRHDAATRLGGLAPDQRAALELVLGRHRSYAQLADLLGIPEPAVRRRARGALEALAPDTPPPSEAGRIADFLLGQQDDDDAAGTRLVLAADPAALAWARGVAEPLHAIPGAAVPALPEDAAEPAPARRRPLKAAAPAAVAASEPEPAAAAPEAATAARPSVLEAGAPRGVRAPSSRLGGAILIGAGALAVAALLAFLFTRGGDNPQPAPAPAAGAAPATAAPSGTVAGATVGPNDVVLRGPAGSKAVGIMRLFKAKDGTVQFALAAQGVPANTGKATYDVWLTKTDGTARMLGGAPNAVGADGNFATGGPAKGQEKQFPTWFATYDSVVVSQDAANAKRPGTIVLSGNLPAAQK